MSGRRHVLGLDVGTTTVRGLVYSESGEVEGQARATIQPIIPGPGCYEIDPDTLWDQVRLRIMRMMINRYYWSSSIIGNYQPVLPAQAPAQADND